MWLWAPVLNLEQLYRWGPTILIWLAQALHRLSPAECLHRLDLPSLPPYFWFSYSFSTCSPHYILALLKYSAPKLEELKIESFNTLWLQPNWVIPRHFIFLHLRLRWTEDDSFLPPLLEVADIKLMSPGLCARHLDLLNHLNGLILDLLRDYCYSQSLRLGSGFMLRLG